MNVLMYGTREKLLQLGLVHAAEALGEELSEAVKHNRTAHQLLKRLLLRELGQREERRIKTSLRLSNLPSRMTLSDFDFGFQPPVDRRQIETLATCAFIRRHITVLIQRPPGVGKTHLAVGLGVAAIDHRFSVAFYPLEELLHQMRKDADVAAQRLRRKKYFNFAGDEARTAAILDRLLHKAVVLKIPGRSYRLQDLERLPT